MNAEILEDQRALNLLGYGPLTEDGLLGPKTRAALFAFEQEHGVGADLHAIAEQRRTPVPPPVGYLDLVERCTLTEWRKCSVCRKDEDECKHKGGPLPRAWKDIDGVTLHQWGAPAVDKPERHLNLKAHYSITRSGGIYRIHPETSFGWHAQGLSHRQIGIEIVGVFCGVEGDMSTRPGCPASWGTHSITQAQIDSTRALIRYLVALAAHHGGRITKINAHRQAAPKDDPSQCRPPDPGSKAWKEIGVWAQEELGLSDGGPGYTLGRGEPLPDLWTGQDNGIEYRTK